ncbi:hypothetical protein BKA70DRAFT_1491993 [Coprinopsis sp. MPI-PUGE-AT-0042]|nr:hypothetical protein BKA70DRAFT_1491993 [Coprinopsis sp. MPI-PUGE-AT-0042]
MVADPTSFNESFANDVITGKVDATEFPSSSMAGMEDHKEYFWDVVRFRVGGTRFQLPLYRFLEESEYFATEYKLSDACRGGFATGVIDLDIDLKDFDSPTAYHCKPNLSEAEWISVLKLCTKWRFNNLRKTAIETLHQSVPRRGHGQGLHPSEVCILAKEFNIPAWLLDGYEGLMMEMLLYEGKEWDEGVVAKIGSDVVIELQRIVIGRYRSMLKDNPVGEVIGHIMGSRLLRDEYEAMKVKAEKHLTAEELKDIKDKKEKEREEIKKEDVEHQPDEEGARLETQKKEQGVGVKGRAGQVNECMKQTGALACCCQLRRLEKKLPPQTASTVLAKSSSSTLQKESSSIEEATGETHRDGFVKQLIPPPQAPPTPTPLLAFGSSSSGFGGVLVSPPPMLSFLPSPSASGTHPPLSSATSSTPSAAFTVIPSNSAPTPLHAPPSGNIPTALPPPLTASGRRALRAQRLGLDTCV